MQIDTAQAQIAESWLNKNCDPHVDIWLPGPENFIYFSALCDADLIAFAFTVAGRSGWHAQGEEGFLFRASTDDSDHHDAELEFAQEALQALGIDVEECLWDVTTVAFTLENPELIADFQAVTGAVPAS